MELSLLLFAKSICEIGRIADCSTSPMAMLDLLTPNTLPQTQLCPCGDAASSTTFSLAFAFQKPSLSLHRAVAAGFVQHTYGEYTGSNPASGIQRCCVQLHPSPPVNTWEATRSILTPKTLPQIHLRVYGDAVPPSTPCYSVAHLLSCRSAYSP